MARYGARAQLFSPEKARWPVDEVTRRALELLTQASRVAESDTLTVLDLYHRYEAAKHALDCWPNLRSRWKPILRHLGHRLVSSLTFDDIDTYRQARAGEPTNRKRPPLVSTVNVEIQALRTSINFAAKRKIIRLNPLAGYESEDTYNVRMTTLRWPQVLRLMSCIDEPDVRAMVLTMFSTGMRKGEVIGLRWEQVDMAHRRFELGYLDTKTRTPRRPRFTDAVAEAIEETGDRSSEYIWPCPGGGCRLEPHPRSFSTIRNIYVAAVEKSGLQGRNGEPIVIHTLRHSFVKLAREAGVPERVIMLQTGHQSRAVFDRYGMVDDLELDRAFPRIADYLSAEASGAKKGNGKV